MSYPSKTKFEFKTKKYYENILETWNKQKRFATRLNLPFVLIQLISQFSEGNVVTCIHLHPHKQYFHVQKPIKRGQLIWNDNSKSKKRSALITLFNSESQHSNFCCNNATCQTASVEQGFGFGVCDAVECHFPQGRLLKDPKRCEVNY